MKTEEKCDLDYVVVELDVSEQWEPDPLTGKPLNFNDTSESDPGWVVDGEQNDVWRYYCQDCGQVEHKWSEILKTHEAKQ